MMVFEPWNFMTRSDIKSMYVENQQLRSHITQQLRWRRQTKVLLAIAGVLVVLNVLLTTARWLAP